MSDSPKHSMRFVIDRDERPVLFHALALIDGRARITRLCDLALLGRIREQELTEVPSEVPRAIGKEAAPEAGGPVAAVESLSTAPAITENSGQGGHVLVDVKGFLDVWDESAP